MHHRVDLLEGEGGTELEIVAAVAGPVVGSQEEASVDSGRHLEVVAISSEVYTSEQVPEYHISQHNCMEEVHVCQCVPDMCMCVFVCEYAHERGSKN